MRAISRHKQSRRAFTLIETIAAIVMLAVAIPPMLWSLRNAQTQRASMIMASQARWLATEKLEDIVADRHSTTRGYSYVIAGNYPAEPSVSGFTSFGRSVAIAETAADLASPGTGYKKATVTISWTDGNQTARSLAIATVVTDY